MPILLTWDEFEFLKYEIMLVLNKVNRIIEIIEKKVMIDIITLGWSSLMLVFSVSLALVVWGRNGF